MKRTFSRQAVKLLLLILAIVLSGCVVDKEAINVVSREAGSGTRDAFVEEVHVVDDQGDDMTTVEADVQNSTNGVMQYVAGNPRGIGYISFGSLNDTVKPIAIDGVPITEETIKSGDYSVARSFNIVWKHDGLSDLANDFVGFIYSPEGKEIIEGLNYISIGKERQPDLPPTSRTTPKGQLTIVGSTSVTPVMEKLAERYEQNNPGVKINITSNGSSAGVSAATEGTADIGMVSRALNDEEQEQLLAVPIALDGIAIVIHPSNPHANLTFNEVSDIFKGKITHWDQLPTR
ncbi:substrate-binding domain-containing protein [Dolosicoccus paucivorans]|uniref:Phosphate ABC transporter substrate-binding protein n=1 Tax=Dolosicoccus paucivorans TaxID=84521 RepID=A0A1G8LMZ0_9LACT|nr:substrate-binding domain-containing protein [Dolosicoccus paucivorans]PMB83865.1 phosphate ABC transporter substrate-binding protein [Dolosicoccus paucivorans]PMC58080.1 phosphate ABC transporter substrate-binding protein [Dolosicoccus paucivorans]SDI57034.1 phosphate ABC transporter substrate-binding protein, PhoT family (TC 3.A.1.7.1) [Dolosicoccus paucivorans]